MKLFPMLLAAAVASTVAGRARGDDRAACFDAVSQGQTLRDQHKLIEAREKFRTCAQAQCPASMRSDCASWLENVDAILPTIVLSAKDSAGHDEVAMTVTVDGQILASKLEGEALPINPGLHVFRFDGADGSASVQVLIKEGEKARSVSVALPAPAAPKGPDDRGRVAPARGSPVGRTIGWIAGGFGVAALATGGVLALVGVGKRGDCNGDGGCPSQSALDNYNSGTGLLNAGYGLLLGGLVVAAVGVTLWVTSPSPPSSAAGSSLRVGLSPGGLVLSGGFR